MSIKKILIVSGFALFGIGAAIIVVFDYDLGSRISPKSTKVATPNLLLLTAKIYLPEFRQESVISYNSDFSNEISKVPITEWSTYTSVLGYRIKHPSDWSVFSCRDGAQAFFYARHTMSYECDAPNNDADFAIIGPLSKSETELEKTPSRLSETFKLNGQDAVRYVDNLIGPDGTNMSELVQIYTPRGYFDLHIGGNSGRNIWEERMLTTFEIVR